MKNKILEIRKELYINDRYNFDDACYTYYVCPKCQSDLIVYTLLPVIDKEFHKHGDVLYTQELTLEKIRFAEFDFLIEDHFCSCNSNTVYSLQRVIYCYHNNGFDFHNYIDFPFENIETIKHDFKPIKPQNFLLFFDTETTGLPIDWNISHKNAENWPRLVQLAWILADEKGEIKSQKDYIIKPDDFLIPEEATRINGISNEFANSNGVGLTKVLDEFKYYLHCSDYIVAHNLKFDFNVLAAEFWRSGISFELNEKESICTMLATIDFCNIPGFKGLKYPKLVELYEKLFKKPFENAHSANNDAFALYECFYELKNRQIIKI